jgi:hypothetical protein
MRVQTTISLIFTVFSVGGISVACSSSSSGGSVSSSCGNFASAEIDEETRCGSTPLSPDERANYLSRFNIVCNDALGAPGSGITTAYLDGCAAALGKNPACTSAVPECNDPAGTLAVGTACASDDQCASTHCAISSSGGGSADGGSSGNATLCGKCGPTIADGAACQSGDVCVAGDSCINGKCGKETTSTGGTGTLGSACQQDSDCATPNRCDFTQGICAAPGSAGASCFTAADCATGLICTSGEQCEQPVASGGACTGGDCAAGLGCDATSHKCATVTFAAQGAACDRDAVLCDRGSCNIGGSGGAQKGVCPTIIADGQPCTDGSTTTACDDFAECVSGTCQISNPADCK